MGRLRITQIGSLPHKDVKAAVSYSLKHDIPFLPELIGLNEYLLEYIKTPGKLSCLDEFKKNKFDTVKIQCVGPATLIQAGYSKNDAVKLPYKHIERILNGLKAETVLLFLDEPSLGYAGFDFRELWQPLFGSFDVIPGVHVCGNMFWDDLMDTEVQIISFDSSKYDITLYPAYDNYRKAGKNISWGVKHVEDIKVPREGDLITPPCGLGGPNYTVEKCEKEFQKLKHISEVIIV